MKSNLHCVTAFCAVLLLAMSAVANPVPAQTLQRQVVQKIEKTTHAEDHQVAQFIEQLAQKDPAQFATFLLGRKLVYVHDESIVYIGIQGTDEVLVVCQIDDFEVGTFYYTAHKEGNKLSEQITALAPSTQGFVTLFERKL